MSVHIVGVLATAIYQNLIQHYPCGSYCISLAHHSSSSHCAAQLGLNRLATGPCNQLHCIMLQILKAAKSFSAVWQDGKTELAKDVLADDVVSKDLLFGNEIHGFDNWSNMVHGVFEVS